MHLVYASDDRYAGVMAVSILSLLESCTDATRVVIDVIDEKLSEQSISRIQAMVSDFGASIRFTALPDLNEIAGVHLDFRQFSLSTYARLWLAELLPEAGRVIYVDCDTLICGPLDSLWGFEMDGGSCVAGALDAVSVANKRKVGLKASDPYVNAGVMVIDLDAWRRIGASRMFTTFLKERGGSVPHNDQGVINACLAESITPLDPKYNVMSFMQGMSFREVLTYKRPAFWVDEGAFSRAVASPVVLHATGSFLFDRPWFQESRSPMSERWTSVAARSPWSNEFPWPQSPSMPLRLLRSIVGGPMRRMALWSLGVLQATVRDRIRGF